MMAEIVGLAAAVLQLLDYSIKGLHTLSKVKGAPANILDLTTEMTLLQEVMNTVKQDQAPNAATVGIGIEIVLVQCQQDLDKLNTRLRKLAPITNDGLGTKSRKALTVAIQEQDLKTRLKRHKDSLSLLLEQQHRYDLIERYLSH